MHRRDFLAHGAGVALLASPVKHAWAQSPFVEGRHYMRLATPQPVQASAGKIEVLEFFWYGCPHCSAFEPALDAWAKKLPGDVMFRRIPVAFRAQHEVHQRFYFAIESMGQLNKLHRRVFTAIHVEHQTLDTARTIGDFVAKNGIDRVKFLEVFDAFAVQSKARQARQISEGYLIDGVPALGVHGRYYTSPSLAGGEGVSVAQAHTLALRLTDQLIAQVRAKK
jgi:protein dithiol oxidoreductase (disulfide-forming)